MNLAWEADACRAKYILLSRLATEFKLLLQFWDKEDKWTDYSSQLKFAGENKRKWTCQEKKKNIVLVRETEKEHDTHNKMLPNGGYIHTWAFGNPDWF